MNPILRLELSRLAAAPRTWWLLAAGTLALAWPFLAAVDATLAAQERLTTLPASVTRLVALPVMARAAMLVAALAVLLAPRWWAQERSTGADDLLCAAPVSTLALVVGKFLAAFAVLLSLVLIAAAMAMSLRLGAPVDGGTIAAAAAGLCFLLALASAVALAASAWTGTAAAAAALTAAVLIAAWAPDAPALARGDPDTVLRVVSLSRRLHPFLQGELVLASGAFFLAATALFLAVAWARLSRRFPGVRVGGVLAVLALGALVSTLAERGDVRADLTATGRHSLEPESRALLAALPAPLAVFVPDDDGVPWRSVNAFLDQVRAAHPGLEIHRVSPIDDPARWQALAMRPDQVLLRVGEREARTDSLLELDFMAAVASLLAGREARVAYLTGGGERDLRGTGPLAWGAFGDALTRRGSAPVPLDAVLTPVLPEGLDLLIVAPGPAAPVPGAPEAVAAWLDGEGGALLWAADPDAHPAWQPVADALGIRQLPGVLVDARAADRGEADPRMLSLRPAPQASAVVTAAQVTLPRAAGWERIADDPWRAQALLEASATSWNETGPLEGAIAPDAPGERRGPLAVALVLERTAAPGEAGRRAAVFGDGDLLANAYLGRGDNLTFGLDVAGWLLQRPALAGLAPRDEPDIELALDRRAVVLLGALWLALLPLAFAAVGLRQRRRLRA